MGSFIFQICSLVYAILIIIIYFSKERFKSEENNIYIYLMIFNIIILIFDLISVTCLYRLPVDNIFNIFFAKVFLVTLILWELAMNAYVFSISKNEYDTTKKKPMFDVKSYAILILIVLLITILPINLVVGKDYVYTEGPAAIFTYFITAVLIIIWFIRIFRRLNNVKKMKCIPIIFFVILIIIGAGIQFYFPQILVVSSVSTFVTILMYFTIENPDMKLINELNIAKNQADKANQAKSEFLSSMSHEIRTPLNAIVGFSQALREEKLPKEAKEEVEDIVMASNGLLEIVNGILDISKIESGKIEIVNSEYKFKELFNELVVLSKGRLGDKSLDFRYSYDDSIPAVLYGDYTRIKQVILNILTNAIKYTKEGYIDFKVSSVIKDDICRIIVSVEDSGIGIKHENINKLFSKFERLDLDKNVTIEGTGLGLAITKKLVELMGGKIVVQSVYGKGSKFTIAIDQKIIADETEEIEAEKQEEKTIDVSGKKVLIVDDNKINLKVASRLLQNYKVITEEVDSGFSCIDKINAGEKYDIILMDDMMPKISGVETLKKLKEIDGFKIPVIALTANAIEGMREKYLSEGFTDYLAKPIDKGELNNIISKYLNK